MSAVAEYQATHNFADFPFAEAIHANIRRRGYKVPSAIQDQTIPHILAGEDIIGLANTGTGKTAAFLLPIINQLYTSRKTLSAMVLAPTRELAQQIDDQFRIFAGGMKLYSTLLVGGLPINRQIAELRRRPHIIIATPGRTMDLIKRKVLRLSDIDVLVLDEADRMLDMGFVGDIRAITSQTPADRQTLFFSATITPQVEQLTKEFLRSPRTISVRTADTSESVDQDVVEAGSKEEKMEKLLEMLSQDEFEKVLLFGETKYGVQRLSDKLNKQGVSSVAIHGNKSQSQRKNALKSFKDNQSRVMVATDVAARGLDIPNVSHVINFDQPATYEDYVHRIGRTGRAGATGKALTFVGKR
jgi:superfamily II DNA/RNA helicase